MRTVVLFFLLTSSVLSQTIPTPESILGFQPGADFHLATYEDSIGYFQALDAASDRLTLVEVGKTSERRPFYVALISTADNLANVERYRDISLRLAHPEALTDDEARSLGLDPARTRLLVIVAASLLTAAAVSVSGLIAFVGLVVPHIVRLLVSHSYRVVVPLSALVGAAFLAFVDVGARTLVAPSELPVGVITAFVGAPFFAFVVWRGRRIEA